MIARHVAPIWIILCSPSGGGKTTLARALAASGEGFRIAVSHTTRKPRGNEKDGREYHFVSPEQFRRLASEGELLEWAEVHGNLYGTSRSEVARGDSVIFDVDHQGARKLKAIRPDAVAVFVLPPSLDELHRRLTARGTDCRGAMERRFAAATEEISHYGEFDYLVVNDGLATAARAVTSIAMAERSLRARNAHLAEHLLASAPHAHAGDR